MTRPTETSHPSSRPGDGEPADPLTHETVTRLLLEWSSGDPGALQAVVPLVIEDLRRIARLVASSERPAATLQPTALVNELYLRLRQRRTVTWTGRAQFFGFAAQAMRRILIDAARSRHRQKRHGGAAIDLDELTSSLGLPAPDPVDLLALDSALVRLEALDPRQVRVVELHFFAGLPMEQVAETLGISRATAHRDWSTARAWLFRELSRRPAGPAPNSAPG